MFQTTQNTFSLLVQPAVEKLLHFLIFIQHGIEKSFPLLVIDGKGDIGAGSILEITKQFCREYKKKLYIVNLSEPEQSSKYNPFANASPTACKDMLINLTDWSEQHYKSNSERFLQRLIILLQQSNIPLSFQTIISHMSTDSFNAIKCKSIKARRNQQARAFAQLKKFQKLVERLQRVPPPVFQP